MIDERVLEEMFAAVAAEIPVPDDGAERVVEAAAAPAAPRAAWRMPASVPHRRRVKGPLIATAAAVLIALVALPLLQRGSSQTVARTAPAITMPAGNGSPDRFDNGSAIATQAPPVPAPATVTADDAMIVKTGTLDLRVPKGDVRVTVDRSTAIAIGLGGYVADSKTNSGDDASAQVTIRVPVRNFETAIKRLDSIPGVTVLGDSENGNDVTAQYSDLKAQLRAATAERDQLLVVLSRAQSIGDILAVRERVSAVQTQVDQLQGRINTLGDQAAMSSLAITLSDSGSAAAAPAKERTGIDKAWYDARHGFTQSIEWIIARSGGALIVLLAALALLFGIRYLYPVVRRGLV